jgi:Sulfatase-modifying factor enzyme 1
VLVLQSGEDFRNKTKQSTQKPLQGFVAGSTLMVKSEALSRLIAKFETTESPPSSSAKPGIKLLGWNDLSAHDKADHSDASRKIIENENTKLFVLILDHEKPIDQRDAGNGLMQELAAIAARKSGPDGAGVQIVAGVLSESVEKFAQCWAAWVDRFATQSGNPDLRPLANITRPIHVQISAHSGKANVDGLVEEILGAMTILTPGELSDGASNENQGLEGQKRPTATAERQLSGTKSEDTLPPWAKDYLRLLVANWTLQKSAAQFSGTAKDSARLYVEATYFDAALYAESNARLRTRVSGSSAIIRPGFPRNIEPDVEMPLHTWLFCNEYFETTYRECAHYLITGDGDTGKSSALRAVALASAWAFGPGLLNLGAREALTELCEKAKALRRFPIDIPLSLLLDESSDDNIDLTELISSAISARTPQPVSSDEVVSFLEGHPVVLLIDGIDEATNPQHALGNLLRLVGSCSLLSTALRRRKAVQVFASCRPEYINQSELGRHANLYELELAVVRDRNSFAYAKNFLQTKGPSRDLPSTTIRALADFLAKVPSPTSLLQWQAIGAFFLQQREVLERSGDLGVGNLLANLIKFQIDGVYRKNKRNIIAAGLKFKASKDFSEQDLVGLLISEFAYQAIKNSKVSDDEARQAQGRTKLALSTAQADLAIKSWADRWIHPKPDCDTTGLACQILDDFRFLSFKNETWTFDSMTTVEALAAMFFRLQYRAKVADFASTGTSHGTAWTSSTLFGVIDDRQFDVSRWHDVLLILAAGDPGAGDTSDNLEDELIKLAVSRLCDTSTRFGDDFGLGIPSVETTIKPVHRLILALDMLRLFSNCCDGKEWSERVKEGPVAEVLEACKPFISPMNPVVSAYDRYKLLEALARLTVPVENAEPAIDIVKKAKRAVVPLLIWERVGFPFSVTGYHGLKQSQSRDGFTIPSTWPEVNGTRWAPSPVTVYDYVNGLVDKNLEKSAWDWDESAIAIDIRLAEEIRKRDGGQRFDRKIRRRAEALSTFFAPDEKAGLKFDLKMCQTILDFETEIDSVVSKIEQVKIDERSIDGEKGYDPSAIKSRRDKAHDVLADYVRLWLTCTELFSTEKGDSDQHDDDSERLGRRKLTWEPSAISRQIVNGLMTPVTCITWFEAVAFARYRTKALRDLNLLMADEELRLPTRAEWKAMRRTLGTDMVPWSAGHAENLPEGMVVPANFDEARFINGPNPIGLFPAFENGLYDFGANVTCWLMPDEKPGADDLKRPYSGASWVDDRSELSLRRSGSWSYAWHRQVTRGFRLVCAKTKSFE